MASVIGFDADSCGISVSIGQQSPDIAQGVDKSLEERDDQGDHDPLDAQGAGDQGLMFGYASDDTPSLMPLPVWLAHRLAERLAAVRRDGTVPGLRPEARRRSPSGTTATARSASTRWCSRRSTTRTSVRTS